jgi:hypothetical protein
MALERIRTSALFSFEAMVELYWQWTASRTRTAHTGQREDKSVARQMNEDMLVRQARAVLDFNWTGEYTMPGPRLYPHQWSWDSAFIAIGYSRYDQERAMRELRHLFEAQWKNGLLPQIVFNPHFTNVIRS